MWRGSAWRARPARRRAARSCSRPRRTELVVVADGLTEPASGMEYRCWVDIDGARQGIGKMFFGGGLAYWVGPSPAVAGLDGGATFGVSLVSADGGTVAPDPVLTGGS